jgi:hypothetical protein
MTYGRPGTDFVPFYRIWAGCLVLFICADAAVSLSLATGGTWLT